jgi:hypothetical protein
LPLKSLLIQLALQSHVARNVRLLMALVESAAPFVHIFEANEIPSTSGDSPDDAQMQIGTVLAATSQIHVSW